MASFNLVVLMGNATRDPEVKYLPSGSAVCDVGMAINRKYTDKDGNKREDVSFVDVAFFGRTAETAGKYVTKGKPFQIRGRLQTDSWDDKQTGQKRSKLKVVCEELQLLGGRGDGGPRTQSDSQPQPAGDANYGGSDEVPF